MDVSNEIDARLAMERARYRKNKTAISARQKEYYQENKADILLRHKKWRDDNRALIKEKRAAFARAHRAEMAKAMREWRRKNPTKAKAARNRANIRSYGLTLEEYNSMLKKQKGVCKICGKENPSKRRLAIDHDHVTGRVRGLLCSSCNIVLGHVRDNEEILLRMRDYLRSN